MRTIYLVRHGQCEDNKNKILNGQRDSELTRLGRQQALATATLLKDKKIKTVYASPLKRTMETAKIIAENLGIDLVHVDKGLIERDFGYMTGKPTSDISKLAKTTFEISGKTYFFNGPGVESFPKLYQRASRVLKRIIAKTPKGNIAIVTHGDTGMMLQAVFYGWDWMRGLNYAFWKNGEIFELKANGLKKGK
ncbi:MAG: histidine phosphatase family protein [Candidatus Falkowbacteria bacterium]